MASDSLLQAIYFTFLAFITLIDYPYTLFYCYKIWKVRNKSFFEKRYPILSIVTIIAFQLQFILRIITDIKHIVPSIDYGKSTKFMYPYGTQIPFILEIIRLLFLYYDYNKRLKLISNEWTSKILSSPPNVDVVKSHKWLSPKSNTL